MNAFAGLALRLLLSVLLLICVLAPGPASKPERQSSTPLETGQVIRLWNDRAPRSHGDKEPDTPVITAFLPDRGKANGCAVIICPGGSYAALNTDIEGSDVARWFSTHGVTAFVLRYRVAPYGQPMPMLDGQRAIRLVRLNAKAWGLDWKRIGIVGFSAGGHLASTVATHWDKYIPASPDPVNGQSCRPDFTILVYPVITMKEKITEPASRQNLLGNKPPQRLVDLYSNELQVKDDTPPAFITANKSDEIVAVKNSELFADALKYHKVPYQFLEIPGGGHGYGLAPNDPRLSTWTDTCQKWMEQQGLMKR